MNISYLLADNFLLYLDGRVQLTDLDGIKRLGDEEQFLSPEDAQLVIMSYGFIGKEAYVTTFVKFKVTHIHEMFYCKELLFCTLISQ